MKIKKTIDTRHSVMSQSCHKDGTTLKDGALMNVFDLIVAQISLTRLMLQFLLLTFFSVMDLSRSWSLPVKIGEKNKRFHYFWHCPVSGSSTVLLPGDLVENEPKRVG